MALAWYCRVCRVKNSFQGESVKKYKSYHVVKREIKNNHSRVCARKTMQTLQYPATTLLRVALRVAGYEVNPTILA
jgi:hypothetical protein